MTPVPAVSAHTRPVKQLAEPARLWIAWAPRAWHSAGGLWTDLAGARISGFRDAGGAPMPRLDVAAVDDLFHLPPVVGELAGERDQLATRLTEAGTPALVELLPGETTAAAGALVVYDLLQPLLAGDVGRLSVLPNGSTAAWPLIAGITDRPEIWDDGLPRLAAAGVSCVQAVAVELTAALRRWLAEERGDEAFDALFHGETASEQQFAVRAHRHGLAPFLPRPAAAVTPRQARNRRFAADLALAGEVWLRLGKPMSGGQSLFRAARGAESTRYDLAALAAEGNLAVMDWLDGDSLRIVEETAADGSSSFLEQLMNEYLDPGRD